MAIDNAKSTTALTTQAIKNRYYINRFLHTATPKLQHKQLGQMDQHVEKGEGGYGTGVVYWTRFTNLDIVTAGQGEGVPTTAVALTAVNVTGSTAQYDAAVSISDLLVYTSFGDMMKQAVERLGENAGKSIDTLVRNSISESLTSQVATGAAHITAIPSTGTLSITEIRKAKRTLSRNDALDIGGYWVAVTHPDSLYDLQGDTTTGGWIDANLYADSTNIFSGEVGKLMGVRFLETSNGYVMSTGSVTGSGSIYVTNIMGREAFGVTNLQKLEVIMHGFGSGGIADPTNKVATAGWKTTFGTAVLNSAFGINLKHVVSSTA